MAASLATLELRNNTDANFRLWGEFISDGLAAGGWTLEDTDINWTTVSAPAQNTFAGYEIWKSPDEVGLTNFYLKLRYGSFNNATTGPALEWQASFSYSGSGDALSGKVTTAVSSISHVVAATSTPRECTVAAGPGYVMITLGNGVTVPNGHHWLTLCRTRNTAIEKTDEIVIQGYYYVTGSPYVANQTFTPDIAFPYFPNTGGISQQHMWSTTTPNPIEAQSVAAMTTHGMRGRRTSPLETILGIHPMSLTAPNSPVGIAGQTVQVNVYGQDRTFMIGTHSTGWFYGGSSVSGVPLFLFE